MFKSKFLRITAIVLLSLFLLHQVYSVIYKPINTETAEYVSVTDGISFTGMIIRNEVLIDKADGGVMHLMVSDGERISKDGVIAKIFSSEKDSFGGPLSRTDQCRSYFLCRIGWRRNTESCGI